MAWRRLCLSAWLSLCTAAAAADAEDYARCAACHLDDGTGVPGMFPPLAGHVERFFPSPAGRAYLSRLVAGGANGTVRIGGVRYAGTMPAVVADLSDGEVADLLNELARRFAPSATPSFSAEDVASARRAGPLSGTERVTLRQRALSVSAPR
ncbi:MAG: cytochrome c [Gammaproteobacteria bacterium]|nr:cytochrome c [Gammaproteobacteria bacterium]